MTVRLVDRMGDDLRIVNAARVSYGKQSHYEYLCKLCGATSEGIEQIRYFVELVEGNNSSCEHEFSQVLSKADRGLINYLMKFKHGTPYEMVQFQFHISTSIKVAREWQRHRIGSYSDIDDRGSFNEISTRYVEMEPEFYAPYAQDVRIQTGKPGHYVMETADLPLAHNTQLRMYDAYKAIYAMYKTLLANGVAKELASFLLPMGTMTEFYWSVNLRSLFNFLSLRNAPTALLEIRQEAIEVEEIVRNIVPVAYQAFVDNGRVAP